MLRHSLEESARILAGLDINMEPSLETVLLKT